MEMLRTESKTVKYVVMAMRDGRLKYIGRGYNPRKDHGYTVKLNGAMMFDKPELAEKYMDMFGIHGSIGKIEKSLELVEVI